MIDEQQGLSLISNPHTTAPKIGDYWIIKGEQIGGRCRITGSDAASLGSSNEAQLALLRRYIWEQNQQGISPVPVKDVLSSIDRLKRPNFETIALDLLRLIRRTTLQFGYPVRFSQEGQTPFGELTTIACVNTGPANGNIADRMDGTRFYFSYLAEKGWIKDLEYYQNGAFALVLSPSGLIHLEEQDRVQNSFSQGFVAMWFSEETKAAYAEGLHPGIADAGYTPFRIDQHVHENRIDDEIIAQIRKSRFLVADFTCGSVRNDDRLHHLVRGGVYFEAGFAQGIGIPVIWTVREDCLSALHFDTRSFPHILWSTPDDLRTALHSRIEALIGKGPN